MQPGLPGLGSILIKIRGYIEDRDVFSTCCESTHSEQGFLRNGQPVICGGVTPAPVLPNLRIGAQGWKRSIGAGQAAYGGIATGGLYCFPGLDGITARGILLAELPQRLDDRQSCTLPSNPTETSPSGKSFPLSHKQ